MERLRLWGCVLMNEQGVVQLECNPYPIKKNVLVIGKGN